MRKLGGLERFGVGVGVVAAVALFVGGVAMFFTSSTNSGAVRAAQSGFRVSSSPADRWQGLHEDLANVFVLTLIVLGALIMVRVRQDWSPRLASAGLFAILAAITGLLLRYDIVMIDGTWVEYDGFGFLFERSLDQVGFGRRTFGATTYRVMLVLHVAVSTAAVTALVSDLRSMAHDPSVHVHQPIDTWRATGVATRGPSR